MKKLFKIFFLFPCVVIGYSCSDDNTPDPDPKPQPEPEPPVEVIRLDEKEMANCYIVQKPGLYQFKADNQFNLGEGLPVPPEISPVKAKLLWQTEPSLISSVELSEDEEGDPMVVFEVKKAEGSAVIAVVNEKNKIEWSWHIWMPKEEIKGVKINTGYEVMNLNLGAVSNEPGKVESYGMLYQWGRKDPFPAAPTLTGDVSTVGAPLYDINNTPVTINNSSWTDNSNNTLTYAIENPTVVMSNYPHYSLSRDWLKPTLSDDSLWGNPYGDYREMVSDGIVVYTAKSCYDPSPAGWRVAPAEVFIEFTTSHGYTWDFEEFNCEDISGDGVLNLEDYNYGWHFNVTDDNSLYFPAAARYDGSYAMLMGSVSGVWGNYWSSAPYSGLDGGAFCALAFQVKDMQGNEMVSISPAAGASRADAYSIRCIKE